MTIEMTKVLAFVLLFIGSIIVFAAKVIVKKLEMEKNVDCKFADQISDEELSMYKLNKAIVKVKLIGMLVTLPGILLVMFYVK